MANFTPAGTIKIGRVPFDNSYTHTMTFTTRAAQQEYFSSVCTRSLDKATYTYVRMDNSIRVAFNAEELYTYNYVMYQNSNYGTKWFYAFIVGVNYINENTTELVLELDVMQTYYFDYSFSECLVEREHVDNDRVGLHTNPEPEMPFNTIIQDESIWDPYQDGAYAVAMVTARSVDGSELTPVTGSLVNGIYNGAYYFLEQFAHPNLPSTLNEELEYLRKAGGSDAVAGLFIYPVRLTNGLQASILNPNLFTVSSSNGGVRETDGLTMPTDLNGYVPRNNKLLTYPYNFCRVSSTSGESADLKWELWQPDNSGFRHLTISSAISPDAMAIMQPERYGGSSLAIFPGAAISLKVALPCSWTNNAYQTWSAQNGLSNAISVASSVAMLAFPAVRGISTAAKALNAGKAWRTAHAGTEIGKVVGGAQKRTAIRKGVSAATETSSLASAGMGAMGLANTAADFDRMAHTPNTVHGSIDGNTLYSQGQLYFLVQFCCMSAEYARIADDFLDMYGYQIDRVKKPNITSRPAWNYIKCSNSCHHGNVPADDMALINSIYDKGITFWHTPDVGNYSLINQLGA